MTSLHRIVIILLFCLTVVSSSTQKSDPFRELIENHLSSKTPYRVIANRNDMEVKYPGCKPIRIWAIIRHGTRNPGRKFISWAQTNLTKIRDKILNSTKSNLDEQQKLALKKWSVNIKEQDEKILLPEGEDELIELAERMQNRFPELLVPYYDPFYYKFKYTATQRTMKSAESFVVGLFGRQNKRQVTYPEALHKDPILRFYKLCNRWKSEVDKNPDAQIEVKRYLESGEMMKAVKSVSKKAGIAGLTAVDVHQIYMACAFETARNKYQMSPWCPFFDRQTIRILEYWKELEHYYVDGYGHELTTKIACPAIADMLDHISPTSAHPNATFYFTHSGTILKTLAHLNLYRDDFILTHSDLHRDRRWRISKIDAFGSNIAFVAFDCGGQIKILTLHQERVVHLPGCPDKDDLCSYEKFQHILKDSKEHCKFNELCRL